MFIRLQPPVAQPAFDAGHGVPKVADGNGGVSTQVLGQGQAGPHLHCGRQAQAVCAAGGWQPQVQVEPGQALQRQAGVASFMMSLLLG